MKLSKGYMLRNIDGKDYLLPYGQNIVNLKHGIKLNESGIILWKGLTQHADEETLLTILAEHYDATPVDYPILRNDIRTFLKELRSAGILIPEYLPAKAQQYFQIGTLTIGYYGPDHLIKSELKSFFCKDTKPDLSITIRTGTAYKNITGELLIHHPDLILCFNGDHYLFLLPKSPKILACTLTKDGSNADIYCSQPDQPDECLTEEIFHLIRIVYLVLAQKHDMFALHSASILYEGKAWLFSGSSGTGKSTHTNLWKHFYNTPILNGDLNLIGIDNGLPYVYGIPWCGTSKLYTTKHYPLGGIILLKQHPDNLLKPLSACEKTLLTAGRFISPNWTEALLNKNLDFAGRLSQLIPIFRFLCTKEPEAATIMKHAIDEENSKVPLHE